MSVFIFPGGGGGSGPGGSGNADLLWSFPNTLATDQNAGLYILQFRKAQSYAGFDARVVVAPTGTPIFVDWIVNGILVPALRVTIAVGTFYGDTAVVQNFINGDTLQAQVTQVGSIQPGQTMIMRARGA
jgi:hypothetical protein